MTQELHEQSLDLSENLVLMYWPRGVVVADRRAPHECSNLPHWRCRIHPDDAPMAVYYVLEALSDNDAGTLEAPARVESEKAHEAYGNRLARAKATYSEGSEEWTLRGEPISVGLSWIRQPESTGHACVFRLWTPASRRGVQFWRTAEGEQSTAGWHPGIRGKTNPAEWTGETGEVLLYSETPRAALRLATGVLGQLQIQLTHKTPDIEILNDLGPTWCLDWTLNHGQMHRIEANFGLRAAAEAFRGKLTNSACDASLDFGSFYDQVKLGGLSFLAPTDEPELAASMVDGSQVVPLAGLDEIALASECLGLYDPGLIAQLLRKTINRCIESATPFSLSPRTDLSPECAPALLLMMAGRYLRLTGDLEFLLANADLLRANANALLSLRRPGEALPTFRLHSHGSFLAKLPASSAVVFAGLSRWAAIEERLGNRKLAEEMADAAFAMLWAAIAPVEGGGLWHMGRSGFVRYLDLDAYSRTGAEQPEALPGSEFHFGTQIIAFWLGLCPDEEMVRRSFEWIDYTYTYSSGRGGPEFPPGYRRTFHALLDVCVRHKLNCGDVVPIFQRVCDIATRAGLPFSRDVQGSPLPAGMLLDNAPYFELVLHRHYGLDYDAGGWRLATPRPLRNYPLTRVTNLRHRNARFSVTWQGRGTIQRVTINGAPLQSRVLDRSSGEHEVVVTLG